MKALDSRSEKGVIVYEGGGILFICLSGGGGGGGGLAGWEKNEK